MARSESFNIVVIGITGTFPAGLGGWNPKTRADVAVAGLELLGDANRGVLETVLTQTGTTLQSRTIPSDADEGRFGGDPLGELGRAGCHSCLVFRHLPSDPMCCQMEDSSSERLKELSQLRSCSCCFNVPGLAPLVSISTAEKDCVKGGRSTFSVWSNSNSSPWSQADRTLIMVCNTGINCFSNFS